MQQGCGVIFSRSASISGCSKLQQTLGQRAKDLKSAWTAIFPFHLFISQSQSTQIQMQMRPACWMLQTQEENIGLTSCLESPANYLCVHPSFFPKNCKCRTMFPPVPKCPTRPAPRKQRSIKSWTDLDLTSGVDFIDICKPHQR